MEPFFEQMKAQQFELKAQSLGSWKLVSRNLKRAADKLYNYYHDATLRDIQRILDKIKSNQFNDGARELKGAEWEDYLDGQLISAYFLLIGYSFENLLKGVLMFEHPEYFKANAKMTHIQSHDLVKLCSRCNIPLQAEEANLLEKCTIYIEWQGKYPIPLESEKMWPIKQADGSWKTQGEAFHGRKTQEDVDILYNKIWNELERRKKSKPGP